MPSPCSSPSGSTRHPVMTSWWGSDTQKRGRPMCPPLRLWRTRGAVPAPQVAHSPGVSILTSEWALTCSARAEPHALAVKKPEGREPPRNLTLCSDSRRATCPALWTHWMGLREASRQAKHGSRSRPLPLPGPLSQGALAHVAGQGGGWKRLLHLSCPHGAPETRLATTGRAKHRRGASERASVEPQEGVRREVSGARGEEPGLRAEAAVRRPRG